MTSRRAMFGTRTGRAVTAACVTVATAVFLVTVPLFRHFFDIGVYYGAVDQWLHHGGHLYDYVSPGTRYGFTYPPFAAVAMAPMTLLPWPVAVGVGLSLSALASVLLLHWWAGPVVRREGWPRWFAFTVIGCLFALLEPVNDTFSFGQVNLLLLALVFADERLLATGRGRWAGIGTGLAAAVKLTPALFIGYLLVTGRRRQASTAAGTAAGATLLTALVAPGASRDFWTGALWDTGRVGSLAYISNQSVQGVLARLSPGSGHGPWLVCVLAVLAVWAVRARSAARGGGEFAGFALTGLGACLVSPVTWVHHLVWAIPALVVLADVGLRERRRGVLALCAVLWVLLCSSVVWLWRDDSHGPVAFLGANLYVWMTLGLLVALPLPRPSTVAARRPARAGTAPGGPSGAADPA